MDVKAIPTGPGQRQSQNRDEKDKNSAAKKEMAANETQAPTQSAEAADAELRASQPTDTQTVVELLAHPTHAATPAKFPTPKHRPTASETAKNLNRKA